jgi:hypothetical protein
VNYIKAVIVNGLKAGEVVALEAPQVPPSQRAAASSSAAPGV